MNDETTRDALANRRLGLGIDPVLQIPKILPELERDGCILLPTDTIYGLSCRWDSRDARERIHRLKGPSRVAFFVALVGDLEMAMRFVEPPSEECQELLREEWPGPVTAVFTCRKGVIPDFCGSPEGTVAFRLPESRFLRDLVLGLGVPVVSTSANRTGESPVRSVEEAWEVFGDALDLYVDAGPIEGLPSTLVDLTGERPELLRVGTRALRRSNPS